MPKPDTKFKFGPWLPDQPDLDNPGLIEAKNTLVIGGSYQPYPPMSTIGSSLSGSVTSALRCRGQGTVSSSGNIYVMTSTPKIYCGIAAGFVIGASTFTDVTPASGYTHSTVYSSLAQYREYVIATNGVDPPQYQLLVNGSTAFTKLTGAYGDAPFAIVVGIIGQFVMLGDLGFTQTVYTVQWSGINAPLNWPVPNSADAIAQQAGSQDLNSSFGRVVGISSGDQWGLVLMEGGIYRVLYKGGLDVFQFDVIYKGPGPLSIAAWIKVGPLVYYLSFGGFFVTDGTSVTSIGDGIVDKYVSSRVDRNNYASVRCGVDYGRRLIFWTLPKVGDSGNPQELMVYNYESKKWTHVFDTIHCFVGGEESVAGAVEGMEVFGNNSQLGGLAGTPGVATFVTPEAEFNPGKRAVVTAVTPQITGTSSVTVKVGSRTKQSDSVTFTAAVAPDSFTGDSNFFVDDRYHRAQIDITGNFTQATGGTFEAQPSSSF